MDGSIMNNSQLCSAVAKEDLARSLNSFNINYTDTGIFGVYTECDKESIPCPPHLYYFHILSYK